LPFFSVETKVAIEQVKAGIYPCAADECRELERHVLSLVRTMLSQDPKLRPAARDVLKSIEKL
jgi:hypothetical protein